MELVTSNVVARSAQICNFNRDMISQNYRGSGLGPSSGILKTRKHNVSETLSKRPNRVGVFPPHLRMETDPASETLCFLFYRIPDDGRKFKNPVILSIIHHRQNLLDMIRVWLLLIKVSQFYLVEMVEAMTMVTMCAT
jgi:hypothetical protein